MTDGVGIAKWPLAVVLGGVGLLAVLATVLAVVFWPSSTSGPGRVGPPLLAVVGTIAGPTTPAIETFTVAAGQVVDITATHTDPALRLDLEVLDRDGAVEGFAGSSPSGSQLTSLRLDAAGDYRVRLWAAAPSKGGAYHLIVSQSSHNPDARYGPFFGDIRAPGQQGRYPIALHAGSPVTVTVQTDPHHPFDALLDLYDPDGALVSTDDSSGKNGEPAFNGYPINRAGIWTAGVRGKTPSTLGAYVLTMAQP